MSHLSKNEINQYNEKGYLAPIDVLTKDEADEVKEEIEFIEKKWPKELEGLGRNYVHLISPMFDKVVHNSKILEKLYNEKVILDHGMEVGKELANVLSGGETTIDKILSEDDFFKLELDSFMRLIENKKTQDRIKHTLATGKPLAN